MGKPTMNPAYLDTQFWGTIHLSNLPSLCYIITAWNPMDKRLCLKENKQRNLVLQEEIKNEGHLCIEITGSSKDLSHQEPSFLTSAPQENLIKWAKKFNQRAIFEILNDSLFLVPTDQPDQKLKLGSFKERIKGSSEQLKQSM